MSVDTLAGGELSGVDRESHIRPDQKSSTYESSNLLFTSISKFSSCSLRLEPGSIVILLGRSFTKTNKSKHLYKVSWVSWVPDPDGWGWQLTGRRTRSLRTRFFPALCLFSSPYPYMPLLTSHRIFTHRWKPRKTTYMQSLWVVSLWHYYKSSLSLWFLLFDDNNEAPSAVDGVTGPGY